MVPLRVLLKGICKGLVDGPQLDYGFVVPYRSYRKKPCGSIPGKHMGGCQNYGPFLGP